LRLRHLLLAAGLIAALSFPIPLAFLVNSLQPLVVHFWLLPQLAVLVVLGLAAGERGWLAGRPPPLVRRVCWLAPPSAIAVLAGTVLATAVAGLYAALSGSARSPIPAVEPSEAELPRGVITKRLSWRCQVSPLLGTFTPTMGRDSASPSRRQRPIGRHLEVHLVATVEQRQDDIAACMTPG